MSALETHRTAFKWASELLEMVMADVTPEQAHWAPPGIANPLGAQYAHAICGTDGVLNMFLKGKAPWYDSAWHGISGVSVPQMNATPEWSRSVQVDLPALRAYAAAIYGSVDEYILSLTEEELDQEHDLSQTGLGRRTVDWMLSALITGHIQNMAGEISCLKGLQGLKGYPF